MVEVEPEFAEEEDVSPDSSCWCWLSLFWRLFLTNKTTASTSKTLIASISVPMSASIEFALKLSGFDELGVSRLFRKSRMAELWPPRSEDMVEDMAGVALV